MNEDALYWIFSTIAQTYGAILGIVGMLTIYRLQTLSNKTEHFRRSAEESVRISAGLNMSLLSAENLVKAWITKPQDQIRKIKESSLDRFIIINREVEKIDGCIKQKNDIRRVFKVFLIPHVGIIVFSILSLIIVPKLASDDFLQILVVFLFLPFFMLSSAFIIIKLSVILVKD